MPAIVNYEVYVLEGKEWSLYARFPGDERTKAIDEAINVEGQTAKPTKVMRETWYPESNTSEEAVAYISPRARKAQAEARAASARASAPGALVGGYGRTDFAWTGTGGAATTAPKASAREFVLRLSMVMVSALIIAVLGTGLASLFVGQLAGMGVTIGTSLSSLLFMVFVALFLLSAVPLVMAYVPLDGFMDKDKPDDEAEDPAAKAAASAAAEKERDAKRKSKADQDAAAAKAEADRKLAEADAPGHHDPELEARQKKEAEAATKAAAEAREALKKVAVAEADPAKAAKEEEAAKPAEKAVREEPDPDPETLKYEQDRARMMKFLGAAVRVLRTTHPQLDAFNKFGVNLYLAGAARVLCDRNRQDRELELLRETIEVIGTKPALAQSFVDKLGEYMLEPRYVTMAQAGRRAMEKWLAKANDAFADLGTVMKEWNTPATKAAAPTMITIVFTDMVGSTDLTHAVGDEAAQEAVRAHNAIVRSALARFDGNEVKHTGDGIMATFPVTANAVAAAVQIQQGIAEHNEARPDMPIKLRVGLNSGEPIAEDNDYFGATVQLASRLCNAADEQQIVCAAIVRDLCAGKAFTFKPLGPMQLKGVRDAVEAYEITWSTADSADAGGSERAPMGREPVPTEPPAPAAAARKAAVERALRPVGRTAQQPTPG